MNNTIVYICPNGYLGGAERFVLEAAYGHLRFGKYKPVIIFFSDGKAVDLARERKIDFFIIKQKFRLSNPVSLFKALVEIRKLFKKNNWTI